MTKDWTELIGEMDINWDSRISYSEFLLAAANKRELLSPENIDTVFRAFDIKNKLVFSPQGQRLESPNR